MSLNYRSIGLDGEPWPAWVRELKGKSGVYVIKSHGSDGDVLYVGSSAGKLYDTIETFPALASNEEFLEGTSRCPPRSRDRLLEIALLRRDRVHVQGGALRT